MKTDRPLDDDDAEATNQWLSGLAGRPGAAEMQAQGARLRAALAPDAQDAPVATWQDIEVRARTAPLVEPHANCGELVTTAGPASPAEAANDPRPRRWLGWAAVLAMGVGLIAFLTPTDPNPDPPLRGVVRGASTDPHWLVERPAESAEALAVELRGLRAEVSVKREGSTVILDIRAKPGNIAAINARLAVLETGLDGEGRLRLVVQPVK